MNRPERYFRARLAVLLTGGALIAALFPMAGAALAVSGATVSAVATNGGAISADTTAATGGTGDYTTLVGPSITSATTGDFVAGTLTLTRPAGFEFGGTVAVGHSGPGCPALGALAVAADAITQVLTSGSTGVCALTFSGIGVRPTAGTPLATGDITASGAGIAGTPIAGHLVEVAGAADPLELCWGTTGCVTTPPTDIKGGESFSVQPTVRSTDHFGNPITRSVTLALTSNSTGANLTCSGGLSKTPDASGIATYSGCAVDLVGTYRLRASQSGALSVLSAPFTVGVGTADHLAFGIYPPNQASTALGTITASVVDLGGNVVTANPQRSVTLSINKNTSSFSCTSGLTRTTVSGTATFTGCAETVIATAYSLTATDNTVSGLGHVDGDAFDITSGSASRLTVCWGTALPCATTPPTDSTGGAAFSTQPTVRVLDSAGNTVHGDSATVVTLAITPGTPGTGGPGTLTCTSGQSRTVASGVATFSGCAIDKVGTGYRLNASSSPVYTLATTGLFNVAAGPASKVVFTAQPGATTVATPFSVQPVVAIQDAGGNTVTSGYYSTAVVTLAIGTNPGGGTLTCTGGLTRAAVAGVATFAGCSIDRAGTGYTLTASSSGLNSATTAVFNETMPGAQITVTASASVITWASPVVLTIHFLTPGSPRPFALQATRDLVTWQTIATPSTDAAGNATFSYRPATTLYYRVSFAGATDLSAAFSNVQRVMVRQKSSLRPTSNGAVRAVARNTSVTFTATVRPSRPELAPARVTFVFYRLVNHTWTYVAKRDVYTNSLGQARYTWKFSTRGAWYVRSIANPTLANANSVWTQVERYDVR